LLLFQFVDTIISVTVNANNTENDTIVECE